MSKATSTKGYLKALSKRFKGQWVSFEHPALGKRVAGLCLDAKPLPERRDGIPDMSLNLRGRSGKLAEVSLVESRAWLHDSEGDAIRSLAE